MWPLQTNVKQDLYVTKRRLQVTENPIQQRRNSVSTNVILGVVAAGIFLLLAVLISYFGLKAPLDSTKSPVQHSSSRHPPG